MNKFLQNLQRQAEDNPMVALGVGVALLSAAGKFIDAAGHAKGSRAYARQVNAKIKKAGK